LALGATVAPEVGLATGVPVVPQAPGLCPAAARAQNFSPLLYKDGKSAGYSHSPGQPVVFFQAEGAESVFSLQ